jgi:hypothetical protein
VIGKLKIKVFLLSNLEAEEEEKLKEGEANEEGKEEIPEVVVEVAEEEAVEEVRVEIDCLIMDNFNSHSM